VSAGRSVSSMDPDDIVLSIVVPVYRNEGSATLLVDELSRLAVRIGRSVEVVFVIDASPDNSRRLLHDATKDAPFRTIIVDHSRNFGSFAAIRTGLAHGTGQFFGVMAADLQEPPELMEEFLQRLSNGEVQVVVGERTSRAADARRDRFTSALFWKSYRRFVIPSMPVGGVDVFGCTRAARDRLLQFSEANSSLVGLLFWLGFSTAAVPYERLDRAGGGRGAWTFRKRVRYMSDSVYSFTDLPLRLLRIIGFVGFVAAVVVSAIVTVAWWRGAIDVPGYTPLILALLASTMLILTALGIVGSYVWRAYENTKQRPLSVVERVEIIERHQ
jgi:glycosyltransferase involved in cell wall biosynthesis